MVMNYIWTKLLFKKKKNTHTSKCRWHFDLPETKNGLKT